MSVLAPGAGAASPPPPTAAASSAPGSKDDVSLIVNGTAWRGWQDIRITRGCERMPADFAIGLTERYPGGGAVDIKPGTACVVKIGSDTVITGYTDRYTAEASGDQHRVQISGRSKSEDLVDCSAMLPQMAISGVSALDLFNQLAKPYGITVSALGTPPSQVLPQFNVTLGETPYEIMERVARYCQVLIYDGTDGNVLIGQVGSVKAASGFVEGVNVERESVTYRMDERYSDYYASPVSTAFLSDTGDAKYLVGHETDPTVQQLGRFRPLIIVSEQTINGQSLAVARARWEKARRIGRSQAANVTVDSWRDSAGALWAPNTLAPISLPALKLGKVSWVIAEVTYRKGDDGTHADVMLMPPEAFQPEPDPLQPFDWQTQQAINSANVTGAGK